MTPRKQTTNKSKTRKEKEIKKKNFPRQRIFAQLSWLGIPGRC